MSTPAERIRRYRSLAEEIRTSADEMRNGEPKAVLLRIADNYDQMADSLEARLAGKSQTPKATG